MGFIIGPIILIYIIVSFFISRLIYKISQRGILSAVSFLMIVTFPFWDLILQKGIKTFFQVTRNLNPKIYSYPEKDIDGRVESLGFDKGLYFNYASFYWYKDIETFKRDTLNNSYKIYTKVIKNYIEFYNKEKNSKESFLRININSPDTYNYEFINKMSARYQIIKNDKEEYLFGIFGIVKYDVIDTKFNNKLLANGYDYSFSRIDNIHRYIRNNILFLRAGASGEVELFWIKSFSDISYIVLKLFDLDVNIITYKVEK